MWPFKPKQRWYLTGPMSNIPKFNIPAFDAAAHDLRVRYGIAVVSPAELDTPSYRRACLASPDGKVLPPGGGTHGDLLARDVKLVADDVEGLILMNDWTKSRGARLEAFVGLTYDKKFMRYFDASKPAVEMHADEVRGFLRSNMP